MTAQAHTQAPTKAQLLTLRVMEHRSRIDSRSPIVRHRIGMMRLMEERGLVNRNVHGEWTISRKGLDAIAKATGEAGTWQVKDFADGWIDVADRGAAERLSAEQSGAAIRPRPASGEAEQ